MAGFIDRLTRRSAGTTSAEADQDSAKIVSLLEAHGISKVLDVGANVGQYAARLRAAGYRGAIVSFEPVASAHAALTATAAGDRAWRVAPRMALGAADDTTHMFVSNRTDMSSVLPIASETLKALPKSYMVGEELVERRRLDAIWGEYVDAGERVFLKLDTQGSEAAIIEGAASARSEIEGIQIELSLVPLYEGEVTYLDMLRRLEAMGFEAVLFLPGFFSKKLRRQLQIDAVLFRPPVNPEGRHTR